MLNLNALFADAKNLSEKFQLNPCFRVTDAIFGVFRQIMFHDVFTPSQFKITVDACFLHPRWMLFRQCVQQGD